MRKILHIERFKNNFLRSYKFLFILLIVNCSLIIANAQNSVLSKGDFYKIAVTQTGVHKIDANFLKKAGIDISTVNPQNIRIYGNGGAMLPQPNALTRPKDLIENAIYIEGEADGKFDNQDYILFYGESPHVINYDSTNKKFSHQINIYSDSTFYFLTISDIKGLRIKNQNSITATKTIDTFDDFMFHEVELKNINNSGRTWYGEYFGSSGEQSFDVKIDGIVSKSPIKISSSAMSIAQVNSTMQVKLNNELLGSHEFNFIYPDKYAVKGNENLQTFSTNSDGNAVLKITYSYDGKKETSSGAYLDYFEIQSKRKLQFYDKQTLVRSIESLANTSSNFQISQVQNDSKIWEVTNPQNAANQTLQIAINLANFGIETKGALKTFILFNNSNLIEPNTIRKIEPQNLKISQVPDLLIVTPKIWQTQAEKLADFRRKNDTLTVLVATTESIYNEFSSGNPDITAIRDFGRFLWLKNPQKFKYLLLFGDASFDYKNYLGFQAINPNNFVPVYESRESLDPISSYSSDDYFGFFQELDGEWVENGSGNLTLDIGVGRLPIKSIEEAEGIVNKLIYYSTSKKTFGKWRGRASFVADNGDYNIHQKDTEGISKFAFFKDPNLTINKIYIDAYPQVGTGNAAKSPEVNKKIEEAVNDGSLILNYTGHGGPIGWAEEQILTIGEIRNYRNINNLPLFVTATCSFGNYDDPTQVSGAELAILNRSGGAIGLLTTTRPVYSSTNYLLDSAFFQATFNKIYSQFQRLGDIVKETKNNSLTGKTGNFVISSGVNNRNFALLGDPSMELNYPKQQIAITKINGKAVNKDTLRALSKVTIEGEVRTNSTINSKFNGTIFVSVFDKISNLSTLGQKGADGAKMIYQSYKNQLFEGKASVKNGTFQVTFTVPKDIVYNYGKGRIQCYAVSADSTADAIGSYNEVIVGGSQSNILIDTQPPKVQLFMNDETFQDGSGVGENPLFIAKISDENGINISQAGIGHEMILVLNDTLQIPVNKYYTSETNDFTKGTILFPFEKLPIGKYTVKLKIWDVYNNSTEVALKFTVNEEKFKILKVKNFPNPFVSQTNFEIQHNREGDDLNVRIEIFDGTGRIFHQIEKNYYHCDAILNDLALDGTNLVQGIYFYRIFVRSLTENLETSASGKLIYMK